MEAVLWTRVPAALSHATALDLHELCDANPAKIHVTVPSGHRVRRDVPATYELHRHDLEAEDLTLHEGIPIVTPYRAILDGLEAKLGAHLIDQALETARRRCRISADEAQMILATRRLREKPRSRERRSTDASPPHHQA